MENLDTNFSKSPSGTLDSIFWEVLFEYAFSKSGSTCFRCRVFQILGKIVFTRLNKRISPVTGVKACGKKRDMRTQNTANKENERTTRHENSDSEDVAWLFPNNSPKPLLSPVRLSKKTLALMTFPKGANAVARSASVRSFGRWYMKRFAPGGPAQPRTTTQTSK